jgi:hypothetical protein
MIRALGGKQKQVQELGMQANQWEEEQEPLMALG